MKSSNEPRIRADCQPKLVLMPVSLKVQLLQRKLRSEGRGRICSGLCGRMASV